MITNATKNNSPDLDLTFNGSKLRYENNSTFLSIRFDHHLTFKNQIDYLKQTCIQRLNIIKILSHKSWLLNKKTLIQIYNVLIRSVIEYSSIITPTVSKTNLSTLQTIQNNALRIILKKPLITKTKITDLHKEANIELLTNRFKKLRDRYLNKALTSKNPIITDVYNEYERFKGGRTIKCKTLLCDFKKNIT